MTANLLVHTSLVAVVALIGPEGFTVVTGVQANSEVSALLGRIPSAVGYQPTLSTDLGMLQERITTTTKGSITSVQVCALYHKPSSTPVLSCLLAEFFRVRKVLNLKSCVRTDQEMAVPRMCLLDWGRLCIRYLRQPTSAITAVNRSSVPDVYVVVFSRMF